jgi:hypothetical protein
MLRKTAKLTRMKEIGILKEIIRHRRKTAILSLYRVHFKWKDKEVQLTAKSLDLTHPYFVSIKDLVFSDKKTLIINPAEDDIIKAFGNSKHLMIPFQTVLLIEEIEEEKAALRRFTLVEQREAEADRSEPEGADGRSGWEDQGDAQS